MILWKVRKKCVFLMLNKRNLFHSDDAYLCFGTSLGIYQSEEYLVLWKPSKFGKIIRVWKLVTVSSNLTGFLGRVKKQKFLKVVQLYKKLFIADVERELPCNSSSGLLDSPGLQVQDVSTVGLFYCFCLNVTKICMAAQTTLLSVHICNDCLNTIKKAFYFFSLIVQNLNFVRFAFEKDRLGKLGSY